jgi:hypothetical protein
MGFPQLINSIKGLSEKNRLLCLGKIRLGLKVKQEPQSPVQLRPERLRKL